MCVRGTEKGRKRVRERVHENNERVTALKEKCARLQDAGEDATTHRTVKNVQALRLAARTRMRRSRTTQKVSG
jgi:hypothetical protein